jgi:2-(3-amino-3-carboxypropyl)histidine synthase
MTPFSFLIGATFAWGSLIYIYALPGADPASIYKLELECILDHTGTVQYSMSESCCRAEDGAAAASTDAAAGAAGGRCAALAPSSPSSSPAACCGRAKGKASGPTTIDGNDNTDAAAARKARRAQRKAARARRKVPDELRNDPELLAAIAVLPENYDFEIFKTVHRVRERGAKLTAIQFPEGLLCYATVISDILERFTGTEVLIQADVTYGACCIDDLGAAALGCDLLVHYGHSCLVPISKTTVEVMYVFVTIGIDLAHLVGCIALTFPDKHVRLTLMGTIQFTPTILKAGQLLRKMGYPSVTLPQAKPLSKTEVLGCTSPVLSERDVDAFVFVADGRFHLESAMIHNPDVPSYQYNPYSKAMTRERYETPRMLRQRRSAIDTARKAQTFGIILGTLGRQGNVNILERLERALQQAGKQSFVLLLAEIYPSKLQLFEEVECWIQVACPRLSIDWGRAFEKAPLLNPYEAHVALGKTAWREKRYPMDFYSKTEENNPWTNFHVEALLPGGEAR